MADAPPDPVEDPPRCAPSLADAEPLLAGSGSGSGSSRPPDADLADIGHGSGG